ncbi:iron chaperone [Nocardioides sp. MAHUQ-72]|uniref:iron chaperone n=1 Tax=unclassified Nocardioides TaxID=2615069 RepID=UPI00360E21DA
MTAKYADVEAYLASFPDEVRPVLEQVRATIRSALPDATETIAYDMPTYKVDGRSIVHFAGWRSYVSVYPLPDPGTAADAGLEAELAAYRATRGTGRFPLDRPMPLDLIGRVVRALRAERLG